MERTVWLSHGKKTSWKTASGWNLTMAKLTSISLLLKPH